MEANVAAKVAAAPAVKTAGAAGLSAKIGSVLVSPMFGVAALAGLIVWELWKGSKDAREFGKAKA